MSTDDSSAAGTDDDSSRARSGTEEAASAWRVVETANRVQTRGALTNGFGSAFAVKLEGPPDEGTRELLNASDTAAKIANEISRPFPTSDSDFEKYSKLEAGSAKDRRPRVRISADGKHAEVVRDA